MGVIGALYKTVYGAVGLFLIKAVQVEMGLYGDLALAQAFIRAFIQLCVLRFPDIRRCLGCMVYVFFFFVRAGFGFEGSESRDFWRFNGLTSFVN